MPSKATTADDIRWCISDRSTCHCDGADYLAVYERYERYEDSYQTVRVRIGVGAAKSPGAMAQTADELRAELVQDFMELGLLPAPG
jgi:hypothetical protein